MPNLFLRNNDEPQHRSRPWVMTALRSARMSAMDRIKKVLDFF